jgi:hypothetical protein
VTGASFVLFGALTFAAYAGSLVVLPFGVNAVMLTAAALLAVATLLSTLRAARLGREPASSLLAAATATTVIMAVVLAGVGSLRSPVDAAPPSDDGSLQLVLANVHYGYDFDGRQRALEVGELLADRPRDATICPSEAARRVDPEGWRTLMEPARRAARRMVAAGTLEIVQDGRVVDPSYAKGPIRLRRSRSVG